DAKRRSMSVPPEEISNFATTVALPQIELSSSMQSACPLYPQKRTLGGTIGMSALGRKRTLPGDSWMSALCHFRTKCSAAKNALFDQIIGAGENCSRNGEPQCLRGLEVDHKIELGRLFDRKVARFCPAQDLIDIVAGASKQVWKIWSVGH